MEVINKKHEEIYTDERTNLRSYIRFGENNTIAFSAGATREFGLQSGLMINFINDENEWWFYCDNNQDGFLLSERNDVKRREMYVYSAGMIALFMKRTKMQVPVRLPLKITNAKHNGCSLVRIEINKPME